MFEEILFGNIDTDLLTNLVPLSYLIFILYFYGNGGWTKKFSDFDKISFSTVMGFFMLYFLIIPHSKIYILINNFFIFNGESNIISPSHSQFIDTFIVCLRITVLFLIVIKILYCDFESLYKNEKAYNVIFRTLSLSLLFFVALLFFFLISFYFGGYLDYFIHVKSDIISSIVGLFIFLFVYKSVQKNYGNPLSFVDTYFSRNESKYYAIVVIIIFLIFSVATGMFLFKPSIVETGEQVTEMNIELLPVSDIPKHKKIVVTEQIEKKYTISTPILIPWVKVKTNLTLESAEGEIDGNRGQYYINDNYFIIDNSSKQVNVTVVGATEDFYLTDELIYDISYPLFQNETEIVNLTLTNNMPVKINIKDMEIRFNENYVLTEYNFDKTKHSANGNGSIRSYTQDESPLHFYNLYLLENESVTISLILTKE